MQVDYDIAGSLVRQGTETVVHWKSLPVNAVHTDHIINTSNICARYDVFIHCQLQNRF
jgi:hypothetical protein